MEGPFMINKILILTCATFIISFAADAGCPCNKKKGNGRQKESSLKINH